MALKKMALIYLNENIQENHHNSVVDARTAMNIYKINK